VRLVGSGFRLNTGGGIEPAAPRLGQVSRQILLEAGCDDAEIAALLGDKAIIADSLAQD
jgi:crotonobetainyl-CoA:carnitine CoA-transferase CaiB-like acyl-CoA transferase